MALPSTNLRLSVVKSTLGASTNSLAELCVHANVNKWSRYKPVKWAGEPNATGWYEADDGNFGFSFPDWGYDKPSSNLRLGDFRVYEHDETKTMPPAYTPKRLSNFDQTTVFDATYYSNIKSQVYLNDGLSTEIELSDLDLNNYYYGCKIRNTGGAWWYKTYGSIVAHAQNYGADLTISSGSYTDFPSNVRDYDDMEIEWFLSSINMTTWKYLPSSTIIVTLPNENVGIETIQSKYDFTIGAWLSVDNSGWSVFPYNTSHSPTSQSVTINGNIVSARSTTGIKIVSKTSWLDVSIRDEFGSIQSPPYYAEDLLRVETNTSNTGMARAGTVVLGDYESDPHSSNLVTVTVNQAAAPIDVYVDSASSHITLTGQGTGSAVLNTRTISFSFKLDGFQTVNDYVYFYTLINGTCYSNSSSVHRMTSGSYTVTVNSVTGAGSNLVGGEDIYVKLVTSPHIC